MIRETIRNYLGNLEILKTTWFFHKIATQWHYCSNVLIKKISDIGQHEKIDLLCKLKERIESYITYVKELLYKFLSSI